MKYSHDARAAALALAVNWLEVRGYKVSQADSEQDAGGALLRATSPNHEALVAVRAARFPERPKALAASELTCLGDQARDERRELLELRVQVDYFGHASAPIQCMRYAKRVQHTAALHAA